MYLYDVYVCINIIATRRIASKISTVVKVFKRNKEEINHYANNN